MRKVLFICVHNSGRSQMAEEYLRLLGGKDHEVESAGFEPTEVNPLVIEVMKEEGVDLSSKKTQSAFDLFRQGRIFTHVITVCDESVDDMCPIFPGVTHRLHLPFPDPAKVRGSHEEKLAKVREIRDRIKEAVREFMAWLESDGDRKLGDVWEMKPLS